MSKYKAGDKFVIEVNKPIKTSNGDVMYEFEGLTLWIREEEVDSLGQLVQGVDQYSRVKGQQEAWELAQQIASGDVPGCYDVGDFYAIFETYSIADAQTKYTYAEAAAKVEAWERKKEIQVGDVVKHPDGRYGLVWGISGGILFGITDEKTGFSWIKGKCTKTGRHIDIEAVLAQIGENDEPAEI